jgi:CheY-like chemotaxis protein
MAARCQHACCLRRAGHIAGLQLISSLIGVPPLANFIGRPFLVVWTVSSGTLRAWFPVLRNAGRNLELENFERATACFPMSEDPASPSRIRRILEISQDICRKQVADTRSPVFVFEARVFPESMSSRRCTFRFSIQRGCAGSPRPGGDRSQWRRCDGLRQDRSTGGGKLSTERIGEQAPPQMTVLLVEDDSAVRLAIAMGLVIRHINVLEASNGEEALRICQTHDGGIDAAVMDIAMPQMWGHEVGSRMATIRPGMPIIYISGHSQESLLARGILSGHEPFLPKPFQSSELAAKLVEVLHGPLPGPLPRDAGSVER